MVVEGRPKRTRKTTLRSERRNTLRTNLTGPTLLEMPVYLALADFPRHLSGQLAENNNAVLERVFKIVERFIVEGDGYVREAAIVGIIEDLQNTNLHDGTTPDQYLPFLLPQTMRWWGKVNAFWSEGRILTDD